MLTIRASEAEKRKVATFAEESGYDSVTDLIRHALHRQGCPISTT